MNDALKLIGGLVLSALLAMLPMAQQAEQQPRIDNTEAVAAASPPVLLNESRVIVASDMRSAPRTPIMLAQLEYPAVEIDPNAEPIEPETDAVPNAPAAPEHDATTLKLLEIAKQIQADADRLKKLSEQTEKRLAEGFGSGEPVTIKADELKQGLQEALGTFRLPDTIAAPATCQCNCDCPTLDEIRQVIRDELRAMSTAKGVDATQEQIENVAAGFDPVSGVMVDGPAIVMLSMAGCMPCDQWWTNERASYEAQGWAVHQADAAAAGVKVAPTFRVFDGKQWHQHVGTMTASHVRAMLGLNSQTAVGATATAGARQEPIQVIYRDSLPDSAYGANYGPSYGDACSLQAWQVTSTPSGAQYQAPVMVPQFANGNCATGACATSAAPRGGLFGGFFRR